MFGTNPIRASVAGNGTQLEVQSVFSTLQGEGPYTGWPAIFIRLGGCNLACDFCDTEFESFSARALEDLLQEVSELAAGNRPLIVITGGEPFRQPIAPLCQALLDQGHMVQIETNGTIYRPVPDAVRIICSPKSQQGRYFPIRPDLLARLEAIKFLVSAHHPSYREIAEVGQSSHAIPVYVQPMDEGEAQKNKDNQDFAVALALKHGYRLSLQTHKLLGID